MPFIKGYKNRLKPKYFLLSKSQFFIITKKSNLIDYHFFISSISLSTLTVIVEIAIYFLLILCILNTKKDVYEVNPNIWIPKYWRFISLHPFFTELENKLL